MVLLDSGNLVGFKYKEVLRVLMAEVPVVPALLGKRVRKFFKTHDALFDGTIAVYE